MLDEAIRSGRSLFLSIFLVFLVWAISWPSANLKLSLGDYLKKLEAWLILEEYFSYNENLTYYIFEVEPGLDTVCDLEFEREQLAPQGGENIDIIPLQLTGKWHEKPINTKICLKASQSSEWEKQRLAENARYFEIKLQEKSILPFDEYDVILFNDSSSYIIPRRLHGIHKDSLRGLRLLKEGKIAPNHPIDWESTSNILQSYGYSGPPESKIKLHSSYHTLVKASDVKSKEEAVAIFGLNFPLDLFVSVSGIIMALLSITLIGPIINVRWNLQATHAQPWIFVLNTRGFKTSLLVEVLLFLFSLAWALCPLYILMTYLAKFNDLLSQLDIWVVIVSVLSFIVASIINIWFILEIKKIRSKDNVLQTHNNSLTHLS